MPVRSPVLTNQIAVFVTAMKYRLYHKVEVTKCGCNVDKCGRSHPTQPGYEANSAGYFSATIVSAVYRRQPVALNPTPSRHLADRTAGWPALINCSASRINLIYTPPIKQSYLIRMLQPWYKYSYQLL